jgi:hypothetical protein
MLPPFVTSLLKMFRDAWRKHPSTGKINQRFRSNYGNSSSDQTGPAFSEGNPSAI